MFFPVVLLGYYGFGRMTLKGGLLWLVASSLFFYSWWNPKYLGLLLISILMNFWIGVFVSRLKSKYILGLGITLNLILLGYYKYYHFFLSNMAVLLDQPLTSEPTILPLAISFFTFQQIAYLVDLYQKKTQQSDFMRYAVFISFFPQLIAGPIVHYREMMPQFVDKLMNRRIAQNLSIGLTIFSIGLCKKVMLADNIEPFVSQVFIASETGMLLTPVEAWLGALAYTFQLYFDFSGYSDMAIGLARCFGIRLPLNFHSPYKATSIIEFWRRWHMTLSRFLRDYLYIPLGGNRKGHTRRYVNLFITMLLGGLWHGAGWTFIIWGGLHGFYLTINHLWQERFPQAQAVWFRFVGAILTFIAVVIGWVFFRSETLSGAWHLMHCMFSWQRDVLPAFFGRHLPILSSWGIAASGDYANPGHLWSSAMFYMMVMAIVVWLLPNTQQFMRYYRPVFERVYPLQLNFRGSSFSLYWRPNFRNALLMAVITVFTLMSMNKISAFLYYQF